MRQMTSMAWKEWREVRAYLLIGLGVLLGLPWLDALQDLHRNRRSELHTTDWVFFVGGILAVFVGVGITCRDLSGKLEDFWRSRPVSVTGWMLTKYFVGLSMILAVCVLPPAVELIVNRQNDAAAFVVWFPFLWAAIFSLGFLCGCLMRKTSQAAMIALAGMLLLYFLPIVLPPLARLNVTNIMVNPPQAWYHTSFGPQFPSISSWLVHREQIEFAIGMFILAIIMVIFALITVKRDWQIAAGRRTMFGAFAAAFLLLFCTAAFRLGTNMPVLQTINLPGNEWVNELYGAEGQGFVGTSVAENGLPAYDYLSTITRRLRVTDVGISIGPPRTGPYRYQFLGEASATDHPEIRYSATFFQDDLANPEQRDRTYTGMLYVNNLADETVKKITLWRAEHVDPMRFNRWQDGCFVSGNRLYVRGDPLLVMDISQPLTPRVISQMPYRSRRGEFPYTDAPTVSVAIPPVPGLSAPDRLKLTILNSTFDGTNLCIELNEDERLNSRISLYRLSNLSDSKALFVKVAEYHPSVLEKMFGRDWLENLQLQNGLLYASRQNYRINSSISVFDVAGEHPLTEIGHFAAPHLRTFSLLPDGRCVAAGGNKIWLIGPPPRH